MSFRLRAADRRTAAELEFVDAASKIRRSVRTQQPPHEPPIEGSERHRGLGGQHEENEDADEGGGGSSPALIEAGNTPRSADWPGRRVT